MIFIYKSQGSIWQYFFFFLPFLYFFLLPVWMRHMLHIHHLYCVFHWAKGVCSWLDIYSRITCWGQGNFLTSHCTQLQTFLNVTCCIPSLAWGKKIVVKYWGPGLFMVHSKKQICLSFWMGTVLLYPYFCWALAPFLSALLICLWLFFMILFWVGLSLLFALKWMFKEVFSAG